MKEITRYLTFDENVFDTIIECKEYEKNFIKKLNNMLETIHSACHTFERCQGCPLEFSTDCYVCRMITQIKESLES